MKRKNLISLNASGEAIEKAIALYYYSLLDNFDFYNNYNVHVFYGHNLPKKEKNIPSVGTLEFYDTYYSKYNLFKYLNKEDLLSKKDSIINFLIKQNKLPYRVSQKMRDDDLFWKYLKRLPIEYLYPKHMKKIIEVASIELNVKLISLFFEDNLLETLLNVDSEREKYSIFALEYNGEIGRYYLNYNDNKSFSHLFKMLNIKSVLSGNSAFFLEQILVRDYKNYIIGYRPHKHDVRKNRDYVLSKLLMNNDSLIEPKINRINELFSKQSEELSTEAKANRVYSIAYYDFLEKFKDELMLGRITEDWYEY